MKRGAVVIGGGHNGLTAAAALAAGGADVLLLERSEKAGGLSAEREFHPGFRVPGLWHDSAGLRPSVIQALDLQADGLSLEEPCPLHIHVDGQVKGILYPGRRLESSDKASEAAFSGWLERIQPCCRWVRTLIDEPPPRLSPHSGSDWASLALRGLSLRRMGSRGMLELLRLGPMSAADWLEESFSDPALREALCYPALSSLFGGPRSAGTSAALLLREASRHRCVRGGASALVDVLLARCRRAGVELRTGSSVRRIRVQGERVVGIVLESGDQIEADTVVACCDPKQTFLRLLDPRACPLKLADSFRHYRCRGVLGKVHFALDSAPEIKGLPEPPERMWLGMGHPDELERAFDAVKRRQWPGRVGLDVWIPSLSNPSLTDNSEGCVVSAWIYLAPGIDGPPLKSQEACRLATERLTEVDERFQERIVGWESLLPFDLERQYGLSGGHVFHGEESLDQLFSMRPTHLTSGYRTPIGGLYLAGGGCHPGGGITGLPGLLGARRVLKDAPPGKAS